MDRPTDDAVADLDSAAFCGAPHEAYQRLRQQGDSTLCRIEGAVVRGFFTRPAVLQVLRDRNFVADEYPSQAILGLECGDGYRTSEAYRRLRRVLADRAFLDEWRRRIAMAARALLAQHAPAGRLCLVRDYAQPLMLQVTGSLLNTDALTVNRWGEAFSIIADEGGQPAPRTLAAGQELLVHVAREFAGSDADPFTVCRALRDLYGERSVEEAAKALVVLLAAGHGTTSDMIVNAALDLLQRGSSLAEQLATPAALEAATEEALRVNPSVQQVFRRATRHCQVGPAEVGSGESILLSLASANCDERTQAEQGARSREAGGRHVAFGLGPSYCIGSAFARVAIQEGLAALAAQIPSAQLSGEILEWKPSAILRGVRAATLVFEPA